jgi:hypothetical protein
MALPLPFRGTPPDRQSSVLDQTSRFPPANWKADTPHPAKCWPSVLETLPLSVRSTATRILRLISRDDIFSLTAKLTTPTETLQSFVATAVWGVGMRAQSRERVLRVLAEAPAPTQLNTVGQKILDAVTVARTTSPVAAYAALHSKNPQEAALNVKFLGPSYGTKILYFAAYHQFGGDLPPLILDRWVATALNWLRGTAWGTEQGGWTPDQYAEYLEVAASWAHAWGTEPDVVERVLFAIGQSDHPPVGRTPRIGGSHANGDREETRAGQASG